MYACDDCGAAILSAAHRARELALRLFSAPKDPKLIVPFFETAMTIDEVGQKLGNAELSNLSVHLVAAARRELSSEVDVTQLDSVLARLAKIADALSQQQNEQLNNRITETECSRSVSRLEPVNSRWPGRP